MRITRFFILVFFILLGIGQANFVYTLEQTEDTPNPLERRISIHEFISTAYKNDTEFSRILVDELKLKYNRTLALPASDIVINASANYGLLLAPKTDYNDFTLSASKLFPLSGTQINADYTSDLSSSTKEISSEFEVYISQQIARNAFGRATRMLDKITGMETDIARYQIVEAYEDYFAEILKIYYNWYLAYENLNTATKALNENIKLYENIEERKNKNIALENDVSKTKLQVIAKQEALIMAESNYEKYLNLVKKVCHFESSETIVPSGLDLYDNIDINFDRDYETFKKEARTYKIFDLFETRGGMLSSKQADELFPSVSLNFGYNNQGDNYYLTGDQESLFAKVVFEQFWPDAQTKAKSEVAKINKEASRLDSINIRYRMYADLKNLSFEIDRQKKLMEKAKDKVILAESIVKYESEDYSYGRSTLNDLIQVINTKDTSTYNLVEKEVSLKILTVEWLRLTDKLVDKIKPK